MTEARATAAMVHVGGRHINGEITETTDLIDITDQPDTTANTAMLKSVVVDVSLAATSHSAQQGNNSRKGDIGSDQELSSANSQEATCTSGQDADLTTLDIETKQMIEQLGTETGYAETTQNHHATVGYKREHSHSPCSQKSPLQLADTTTSACRAAACVVESERELVVDGETLHSGGQGEERQPRKRAKLEAMEREVGGGNGSPSSIGTPETQPDTPPPSLLVGQDNSMFDSDPSSSSEVTAALPQSPPPAIMRGALTRPTSLTVSLPLVSVSLAAAVPNRQNGEGDNRFPNSEEEQTPDGGRRELVGHPYRYTPINNGETVVTPERPVFPPNIVFGQHSPLSAYRRQLSNNNAQYNLYTRSCERLRSGAQTQRTLRRQFSEPPYHVTDAPKDNNGRIIGEEHVPLSRTATL